MGTNFYLLTDPCPHCGRSDDRLHIGKSSAGWCFSLHVDPDNGISNLEDWKSRWETGKIIDENGTILTPAEMLERITERAHPVTWEEKRKRWPIAGYTNEDNFHQLNNSVRGPNNLLRHKIDGRFCIGHGEGTWDLITGEFS